MKKINSLFARRVLPLMGAAVLLASAATARASFIINLNDGVSFNRTVVDNDGLYDLNGTPKIIITQFGTAYGDTTPFTISLNIGTSSSPGNPVNGSLIQITSIDVTNSSAGTHTLTITIADTDFNYPTASALELLSSFGGTLSSFGSGNAITFESYADNQNSPFNPVPPIAPLPPSAINSGLQSATFIPTGPGQFSYNNNASTSFYQPNPYFSMASVTTITLAPNAQANVSGTTSVIDPNASAPEPASLGLLGVGALALLRRRR